MSLLTLEHFYRKRVFQPNELLGVARQVIEHAGRMRAEGALGPHGRVFATHIAHEGNPAHPDLAAFAKQHAYEVAYDGLILTI
jgi:hypothetical protein